MDIHAMVQQLRSAFPRIRDLIFFPAHKWSALDPADIHLGYAERLVRLYISLSPPGTLPADDTPALAKQHARIRLSQCCAAKLCRSRALSIDVSNRAN